MMTETERQQIVNAKSEDHIASARALCEKQLLHEIADRLDDLQRTVDAELKLSFGSIKEARNCVERVSIGDSRLLLGIRYLLRFGEIDTEIDFCILQVHQKFSEIIQGRIVSQYNDIWIPLRALGLCNQVLSALKYIPEDIGNEKEQFIRDTLPVFEALSVLILYEDNGMYGDAIITALRTNQTEVAFYLLRNNFDALAQEYNWDNETKAIVRLFLAEMLIRFGTGDQEYITVEILREDMFKSKGKRVASSRAQALLLSHNYTETTV